MKKLALVAALLALSLPASAGDPDWIFAEGQTFTYECSTEFHYVLLPITAIIDGKVVRRGGASLGGGTSSQSPSRQNGDPQWETVTFKAHVLAVDPDGTALIRFTVRDVCIETRFDSNGDYGIWDSKESPATDISGFKRYEAILGCEFHAKIGADGSVVKTWGDAWPEAERIEPNVAEPKAERAAAATHDPTPAAAWLNIIFSTAPDRAVKYRRTIRMPKDENFEVKFDGQEGIRGYSCVRSKFRSADKKRVPNLDLLDEPDRVAPRSLESLSLQVLETVEKKGVSWFSRKSGCMVRVEIAAAAEMNVGGSIVSSAMSWKTEVRRRGQEPLPLGPWIAPEQEQPLPNVETGGETSEAAGRR